MAKVTGGRKAQQFVARAKAAQRSAPKSLQVGFFETDRYDDGNAAVALVAFVHEFGSGEIPESAFFRQSLAGLRQELAPMMRAAVRGRGAEMVVDHAAATRAAAIIEDRIRSSIDAHDLRDTGQLRASVDHRID